MLGDLLKEFGLEGNQIVSEIAGGNSDVYQIRTPNDGDLGIKVYRGLEERVLRMYERESSSLDFLGQKGFTSSPRFVAGSKDKGAICYTWIEGKSPESNLDTLNAIFYAMNELLSIYQVDSNFDKAIDAVLSGIDVLDQLSLRIVQLKKSGLVPRDLLIGLESARLGLIQTALNQETFSHKTYSFSDFGTHNMIMNKSGKFHFIDLEFFGIDSFAKFFTDLICHPRTEFSSLDIVRHLENWPSYSRDFERQLRLLLPAIALKWSVITSRRTYLEPSLSSNSESPEVYLEYFGFLSKLESIEGVQTFKEFIRMRDLRHE